ncbi:hypothetical protein GGR56DRAFT_252280 [Xylariaceae sp. FL0804]|nr:hypothetical protein GGR56DRAFT_252280 [Xylariaceae sp. FL0804]
MRVPPPDVIAKWPEPNYVNPETRGPAANIVGSILLLLATMILAIRLYTRKSLTSGLGLDDILMALAWLPATALLVTGFVAEGRLEWNRHIWDVEAEFFTPDLEIGFATFILFDLSTSLVKLSMLAMLYRLTAASRDRLMSRVILALAGVIGLNGFVFIVVIVFQCRPLSAAWTLTAEPHECINESAHLAAANIINTITDFIVVLLPIKTATGLELPAKQRAVIVALFGLGLIASGAGIARTFFSFRLFDNAAFDTTWYAWAVWFASTVELFLGIICSSVPATRPFFARFLPHSLGARQSLGTSLRAHHHQSKLAVPWHCEPPPYRASTTLPSTSTMPPTETSSTPASPVCRGRGPADLNKPLPPLGESPRPSHVPAPPPPWLRAAPAATAVYEESPARPAPRPSSRRATAAALEPDDGDRRRSGARPLLLPARPRVLTASSGTASLVIVYQGEPIRGAMGRGD